MESLWDLNTPLDVLPTDTKQTDKNAPHCYCPHGEIMNTDNLPGHKCLCFPHQLIILHLGTQRTDQIIKNCKWYKHSAQLTYNTCCIDTINSVYIFQQHGCQNLAGGGNGGGYQEQLLCYTTRDRMREPSCISQSSLKLQPS